MTEYLDQYQISKAAELLKQGKLVAFPTETVYGLGARADSDNSVRRIFEAKRRPSFNPLIVHVPTLEEAQEIAIFDPLSLKLARELWPGPITFVVPLKRNNTISTFVTAGLDTVAIRIPNSKIALSLLKLVGAPIAAPSANLSGRISPTSASLVLRNLGGKIDAILDGGRCIVGLESTIISINPLEILRPGGITTDYISKTFELNIPYNNEIKKIKAPGQLKSHYAPAASVRLNALSPLSNEILLGFGKTTNATLNLSETSNLSEAAQNLFSMLNDMDEIASNKGLNSIAISPIPNFGIGLAINDRLTRAAAPRP